MIRTILIFALFIVMVVLMMRGKLTFVISLPLLALGVAIIAGAPFLGENGIMAQVFEGGVTRMASSYAALMISAWLGAMMNNTGISKTIIKTAAELGGDRPLLVTLLLTVAVSLVYTTISGLGGVIMIASIAVPIMISVGVPGLVAICIFLFAYAIGLTLNLSNWAYFSSLTGVSIGDVQLFAWILCGLTAVMCLVFILFQFKREGSSSPGPPPNGQVEEALNFEKAPAISLLTPIVPIVLVVAFSWTIVAALFAGIAYCFITTAIFNRQITLTRLLGLTTKSAIDGVNDGALGILSMVVIGMLSASLNLAEVINTISGTMELIVPSSQIPYILFFALLAPLALYRGPLNIWGIGAGLSTVIVGMGILPATAVMCGFIACERMQVICDPTNSHNVWLANYVGTDTMTVLKKVFPFVWVLCAIAVVVSGFMWF